MAAHIVEARRLQRCLRDDDAIEYVEDWHPWKRPGIDGCRFATAMLAVRPATVGDMKALGALFVPRLKYRAIEHFAWWATGRYKDADHANPLKIAGLFFQDLIAQRE
jgi:hypothetical protein